MIYVQYRCPFTGDLETVDEFETWKEAKAMIKEYLLVGPGYYLSRRACKAWRLK